jgi:Fic family protein
VEDKLLRLKEKKEYYQRYKGIIDKSILENYDLDFAIRYTHESTKIEGNTLSLIENKLIIEDRVSVGGKAIQEIYEVENHNSAFEYIKDNIKKGIELDSSIIKNIHGILMDNIMQGGIYRYVDVSIIGAGHKPPSRTQMHDRLNAFYYDLENKSLDPIEKASWVHAEFVAIHPFQDGNGRTSRILMNYILIQNGYLPINIKAEDKIEYFEALDEYGLNNNLNPFLEFVLDLEEEQMNIYIHLIKDILDYNKNLKG